MALARPVMRAGAPAVQGFVAYYRVSTEKQGRSGLGLEAQREAVARRIEAEDGRLVAEFQEVESGKRADRPQLARALAECRAKRATLIVAKIDRLARNTKFLLTVSEGAGDRGVVFCELPDLPRGPMSKFLLTLLAAVAELEAGMISQRTKVAMAAAIARGVKMGNPRLQAGSPLAAREARAERSRVATDYAADVMPYITAAENAGAKSLRQLAAALTARGVQPPNGGEAWHATQVRRIMGKRTNDAAG